MKSDKLQMELDYIKNNHIKENAKILVNLLPDYFFEVPASSTGKYHPAFAASEAGLLRHTKAATRIGYELLKNKTIGYCFTDDEKDLLITAIMLHDGLKHGKNHDRYARFDHPLEGAKFVKENSDKTTFAEDEIKFLYETIASHMGEFTTSTYSDVVLPEPHNKYQRFVHMCDYLASRKFLSVNFDENNNIKEV